MAVLTVHLHGGLDRYTGVPGSIVVHVPPGATLLELQDHLRIPRGEAGLFLVDGEMRDEAVRLVDGARVDIFPMFGGG